MFQFPRVPSAVEWCGHPVVTTMGLPHSEIVGSLPDSRLPHAYRSYATSFIGAQRRGIHPLLILSCLAGSTAVDMLDCSDRLTDRSAVPDPATTHT